MTPLFHRGEPSVEDERELLRRARNVAAAELEAMKGELAERIQALAERESELVAALTEARGTMETESRAETRLPKPIAQSAGDASRIEQRLAELREAEKLFLVTQGELTARSEAIAARERLVADRERKLNDDGGDGRGDLELAELEARLRRLERPVAAATDSTSFADGLESLRRKGTRTPRS